MINNEEELEFRRRIEEEVSRLNYDDDYYTTKLAASWKRAQETEAYRGLGPFSMTAFSNLPVTSKDSLKAAPMKFVRVGLNDSLKYYQTTGTTGRPTPTPRTWRDIIANTTSVANSWREFFQPTDRALILLPSDIVPVADLMVGVCEELDITHAKAYPYTTGISDWDRIIDLWSQLRPSILFVAPGVLLQLTQIADRRGVLSELRESVRSLMLLGEVSTPELRGMLARRWEANAYDASYGSTESGTLATCCSNDRLHLLAGANYLEILQQGAVDTAHPGATGRLVVTPLNHDARPLLRLDAGDIVTLGDDCPCGAATMTLTVHGRHSDNARLKGHEVTTRAIEQIIYGSHDVFGYLIEVNEAGTLAQLVLERSGGDRSLEEHAIQTIQDETTSRLGFAWDSVRFANRLPQVSKSGGSQKSWKRTNFKIIEEKGASS